MKDMIKTASLLDKILRILSIATKIGIIGSIVGLGIIAAGVIFGLPLDQIGTGFEDADQQQGDRCGQNTFYNEI